MTTFRFYRPADPFLDAGVFVLLFLATGCILVGCLWYAAVLQQRIRDGLLKLNSEGHMIDANDETQLPVRAESPDNGEHHQQPERLCCCVINGTCFHIVGAVQAFILVAGILVLSFFFRPVAGNTFIFNEV